MLCGGKYLIVGVLGSGGFGITYRARHYATGVDYAIKEFFVESACVRAYDRRSVYLNGIDPSLYNMLWYRFKQEAYTLARLSHPNVVGVRDIFDENGTTYMVMDFVVGETLSNKVSRYGALSAESAKRYIDQICVAMEHVHANGILHRDIKPDNIIINREDNAVLIDFGAAKGNTPEFNHNHTVILSLGYAPPEQHTSDGEMDFYSDVYSIGAVLYFILTAQKPIDSNDRDSTPLPSPMSLNKLVPGKLNLVVMKAMEMDPAKRYQSVGELRDALSDSANRSTGNAVEKDSGRLWIWLVVAAVLATMILIYAGSVGNAKFGNYKSNEPSARKEYLSPPPYLSLRRSSLHFDGSGGTYSIPVDANNSWRVYGANDWCQASRDGDNITIYVQGNGTGSPRTCSLSVVSVDLSEPIVVTQDARQVQEAQKTNANQGLTLSSNSISFGSDGCTKIVNVYSGEQWYCNSISSWIELDCEGNDIYVTVKDNDTGRERHADILFRTDSGLSACLKVYQGVDPMSLFK